MSEDAELRRYVIEGDREKKLWVLRRLGRQETLASGATAEDVNVTRPGGGYSEPPSDDGSMVHKSGYCDCSAAAVTSVTRVSATAKGKTPATPMPLV